MLHKKKQAVFHLSIRLNCKPQKKQNIKLSDPVNMQESRINNLEGQLLSVCASKVQ